MSMKLPPDEQIGKLRRVSHIYRYSKWLILGLVLFGILLFLLLKNPIPLMLAAFFGIVIMAEKHVVPNIAQAVNCYDNSLPTVGQVKISSKSWDMDLHYTAITFEEEIGSWSFQFIPQAWEPHDGFYEAKIWRSESQNPPSLVMIEEGVLIPRDKPKRLMD